MEWQWVGVVAGMDLGCELEEGASWPLPPQPCGVIVRAICHCACHPVILCATLSLCVPPVIMRATLSSSHSFAQSLRSLTRSRDRNNLRAGCTSRVQCQQGIGVQNGVRTAFVQSA